MKDLGVSIIQSGYRCWILASSLSIMALRPTKSSWQADIYVPDYVPQAFLAVNESPATVIPPPRVTEIDFASYIASYAGSRFLVPLPQLSKPEYNGAMPLKCTASPEVAMYNVFFEDCLALESEAHAAQLEEYKLYGAKLDLVDSTHVSLFRLKLPGLREGTPAITFGESILLRQLILDQTTKLPRGMDAWLRPGGRGLGLPAPGFTGFEVRATVYAVDRVDEALLLHAHGLNLTLPLTCNVAFVLPTRLLQAMQRATQNAAKSLDSSNGFWFRQMLFPEESNGVVQTALPSAAFRITWYDADLNFEQMVRVVCC